MNNFLSKYTCEGVAGQRRGAGEGRDGVGRHKRCNTNDH
jgi:hypothetical protein